MKTDADALIIGGGPAGASAAIGLARAGWRVSLVEQHAFPRQKVCGECIAAGNFQLLDELGVGQDVRRLAGPELNRVGWMGAAKTVMSDMPRCSSGPDEYGRALGRDVLDALLLRRARDIGVTVFQPARVRTARGRPGAFNCDIVETPGVMGDARVHVKSQVTLSSSVLIDACGSWGNGPRFDVSHGRLDPALFPKKAGDLFAFKASFINSRLPEGFLPVIATSGGYGGMVVADGGRTTVALCLRRDALRSIRERHRGLPAGIAVEMHLRERCHGVDIALQDSVRLGAWLTVGPLRPGIRLQETPGIYRVGNASGESHPLVGEGMSMALQSSRMLVDSLLAHADRTSDGQRLSLAHRQYAQAWRAAFGSRLRVAVAYAHIAMHPVLSAPVGAALRQWPALLNTAARFAGKARPAFHPFGLSEESV
jgi:flavin-dependent dehydrogenase